MGSRKGPKYDGERLVKLGRPCMGLACMAESYKCGVRNNSGC